MAIVRTIQCSHCGFKLMWGTGVAPYVKTKAGFFKRLFGISEEKIILPDPPGHNLPKDILDKSMPELIDENRIGHYAAYVCLACCATFSHDSATEKKCPKCKSTDVKSVFELVGKPCPKCKDGVIEDKKIGVS